jgi:hypothetical protein
MVGSGSLAVAQRTTFNPSLWLTTRYEDNVRFVNDPAGPVSGESGTFGVGLPLSREWRRSSVGILYRGKIIRYRQQELKVLDNDDHRLDLNFGTRAGRTGSLGLALGYTKTQQQGNPLDPNVDERFLARRNDRETVSAGLRWGVRAGRRWTWSGDLAASQDRYQVLGDPDVAPAGLNVEDRDNYGGGLSFSYDSSRRWSVGAIGRYRRTEFELSPDEDVYRVSGDFRHRFTEDFTLGFRLGRWIRVRDEPADAPDTPEFEEQGWDIGVTLGFNEGLEAGPFRIRFDLGASPSYGGSLEGSSTNAYVGATLSRGTSALWAGSFRWDWALSTRYTRREPTNRDLPSLDTGTAAAWVQRTFARVVGLRAGIDWGRQYADGATDPNGQFFTATLSLVWHPLLRSRVSTR